MLNSDYFKTKIQNLLPQVNIAKGGSSMYVTNVPAPLAKEINDLASLIRQNAASKDKDDKARLYNKIKEKEQTIAKFGNFLKYKKSFEDSATGISSFKSVGGGVANEYSDSFLSMIGENDAEYTNSKGQESYVKSGSRVWDSVNQRVSEADTEVKKLFDQKSNRAFTYYEGVRGYEDVKKLAKDKTIIPNDFKGSLIIKPKQLDGEGNVISVEVVPVLDKTKGGVKTASRGQGVEIQMKDIQKEYPGLNLVNAMSTNYDAKFGNYAPPVYLGKSFDISEATQDGDKLYQQAGVLYGNIKTQQQKEWLDQKFVDYRSGKYNFKLEVANGTYGVSIYNGKTREDFVPTVERYEEDDISVHQINPEPIISEAFFKYLYNSITDGK